MNARDRAAMDRGIHRARMETLVDEPPELGESLDAYVTRINGAHGTSYTEAAVERYQGATAREARAEASARDAVAKIMRK